MRGIVPDLASAVPIAQRLPGVYQEGDFTQRFVSTFDTALAPVIATLDGLPGYVDPWLAPPDFLDWLAGWVGVEVGYLNARCERQDHIVVIAHFRLPRG